MNKNLFAIMALATMPTLIFAQQTESENEKPVKLKVDSIKTEFLDVNYLSKVDFILLDSNKNAFFSNVSKILEIGDMFCFVCKKENKIVKFMQIWFV